LVVLLLLLLLLLVVVVLLLLLLFWWQPPAQLLIVSLLPNRPIESFLQISVVLSESIVLPGTAQSACRPQHTTGHC
jgi:hypothetical protein